MSTTVRDELRRYAFPKVDDPEIRARQRETIEYGLKIMPEIGEKLVEEGRLKEARASLRSVLGARGLALGAEDEARIDGCEEISNLERWIRQAVTATSLAEALR